jgi:LPXTG-motif cell wall-anchored protein
VGDTIEFKTVVYIGKHQSNVILHDVMQTAKLAFDYNVQVTGAIDSNNQPVSIATSDYTIYYPAHGTETGNMPQDEKYENDTFAIKFENSWTEALAKDTTVTITYSATLTEAAIVGLQSDNILGTGNDNQTKVDYGDSQQTEWDYTRTYTWGFDILKYTNGESNAKVPLDGAEFELSKSGTTLAFIEKSKGNDTDPAVYQFNSTVTEGTTTKLVTPKSGKIKILGLDADTYTLTETEAPKGYNKLAAPISVLIDSDTDTAQGKDGNSQAATMSLYQDKTESSSPVSQIEVLNNTGTQLPSTGGIGTTIFYAVGGILVLAAIVLLITKKRMSD